MEESMKRSLFALLLAIASLIAVSPNAAVAASSSSQRPSRCDVVAITSLGFHPRHVAPGGHSTIRVVARNCTRQPQNITVTWLGQFVGSGVGIPPGCPAIDPLAQGANFKPRGTFRGHLEFVVFSSCTATALSETVRFTGADGTVLAEKTVELRIRSS
jgi:hypothetical protein